MLKWRHILLCYILLILGGDRFFKKPSEVAKMIYNKQEGLIMNKKEKAKKKKEDYEKPIMKKVFSPEHNRQQMIEKLASCGCGCGCY